MPIVRADLKKTAYIIWLKAKADLGEGRDINNAEALMRLVKYYNTERGRRTIV